MPKKILLLSFIALAVPMNVFAAAFTQGGDIEKGARVVFLEKNNIVSYYKTGKEGTVNFMCDLTGINAKAFLFGGKNLIANTPEILSEGLNGPYHWILKDTGAEDGNIKVQLTTGNKDASIQCRSTD